MATKINLINLFLLSLIAGVASSARSQIKLSGDVPNPDSLKAFQEYWSAFSEYEKKISEEGRKEIEQKNKKITDEYEAKRAQFYKDSIAKLGSAEKKYRAHLKQYPNATNRAHILFNLSQIYNLFAKIYARTNTDIASSYRNQAIDVLSGIDKNYPSFSRRSQVLYFLGSLLEKESRMESALPVWSRLAAMPEKSEYVLQANLAIGDYYFDRENPKKAIDYYQAANSMMKSGNAKDFQQFHIDIIYRLAWGGYRTTDLESAIRYALSALTPGWQLPGPEEWGKMKRDLIDILADSLYEINDYRRVKRVLGNRSILASAPFVANRMLERLEKNKLVKRAIRVAEFSVERFSDSSLVPRWYGLLATSYNSTGDVRNKIYALERLAMLLPKNSLWRVRYKNQFELLKDMEQRAESAAAAAAAYHYDYGLRSGNLNNFMKSAGLYESLIKFKPHSAKSNHWRLRVAHCYFFSSKNVEAAKRYADLTKNYKLDDVTLEVASYQLVLTREKRWREVFAKSIKRGMQPKNDESVKRSIADLRASVDKFANRFPRRSRAVDLLLVMASSYRDYGQDQNAVRYWERVLISKPNTSQRASAIRGLIAASIKQGKSRDVVALTRRFLKLEDWSSLGVNLGNELMGVISTAALDEGKRLNNKGEIAEAGIFLVEIAKEFKAIPNRDKILRDGAYMLAIAGQWSSALEAAEFYQKQGMKKFGGDMQYLMARSYEFQVRFAEAAQAYLLLGQKFPKHSRALTSLRRSESLAVSENDFKTAGIAVKLIAERSKNQRDKTSSYARSIDFFAKGNDNAMSLEIAEKNRKLAKGASERVSADLAYAKALRRSGKYDAYLKTLTAISSNLRRQKNSIDGGVYSAVHGEVHFLLGEESRDAFEDFDIYERGDNVGENIRQKNSYYRNMVTNYAEVTKGNDYRWAPQARYRLAEASENYADDLTSISSRLGAKANSALISRSKKSADRLRKLAKKYLSNNLLERRRNPQAYRGNEWIKKSSIRLSGYGVLDDDIESTDSLPTASYTDMPTQWSP